VRDEKRPCTHCNPDPILGGVQLSLGFASTHVYGPSYAVAKHKLTDSDALTVESTPRSPKPFYTRASTSGLESVPASVFNRPDLGSDINCFFLGGTPIPPPPSYNDDE